MNILLQHFGETEYCETRSQSCYSREYASCWNELAMVAGSCETGNRLANVRGLRAPLGQSERISKTFQKTVSQLGWTVLDCLISLAE
jgi:hypothetical protein